MNQTVESLAQKIGDKVPQLPAIDEALSLTFKDSDILVLRCDMHLTQEQFTYFKGYVEKHCPALANRFILLQGGMRLEAVLTARDKLITPTVAGDPML